MQCKAEEGNDEVFQPCKLKFSKPTVKPVYIPGLQFLGHNKYVTALL